MSEAISNSHTIVPDHQGEPAFVVIPWSEYRQHFEDISDLDSDNAIIPHEVVARCEASACTLLGGWRRFRGMTQKQLAEQTGILHLPLVGWSYTAVAIVGIPY